MHFYFRCLLKPHSNDSGGVLKDTAEEWGAWERRQQQPDLEVGEMAGEGSCLAEPRKLNSKLAMGKIEAQSD